MHLIRNAAAVAAAASLLALSACSSGGPGADPGSDEADASVMGHIHGLGVDPADGVLYTATHYGLFRLEDGAASRVADRWQDTMAFTVVGERHFLGSGHPDLREDLPVHLGLIESTDAGVTWNALALQGEADFHALEPAGDLLYASDALTGSVMVTSDNNTFRTIAELSVVDLAADPRDPAHVLATTPRGTLESIDSSTGRQETIDAPPLAFLDWPKTALLVGLGPSGDVHISQDAAATWTRATSVPGDAAAIEITTTAWYVATTEGLFSSTDEGRSWAPMRIQSR